MFSVAKVDKLECALGVGVRLEHIPLRAQSAFKFGVVFNNAVVYQRNTLCGVGVSVA